MEGLIVWLYICVGVIWIIFTLLITNLLVDWLEETINKFYFELSSTTIIVIQTALNIILLSIPLIFIL